MKEQLVLFALLCMAFTLLSQHFTNRGSGTPFAYALAQSLPQPGRNLFSELYQKAQLWFEKEVTDEIKGLMKEGFEKFKGEIKTIVDQVKEAADKKASSEDIEKLKGELETKIKEVQDYAEEIETKAGRQRQDEAETKGESFGRQFEKGLTALKEATKNAGGLKSLPKRDGREINIDLKAVSNMTTGYSLPAGATVNLLRGLDMEAGVAKDPTTPLFVRDIISVGTTDKHTVEWVERLLIEGGAGQVAEAALFPQISVKWDVKTATSKKTAAYAKITEEMLEDVDFVLGETQDEIVSGPNSILVQLENQLLSGDGTGENHKGLFTQATAFALPAGFTKHAAPNLYDAASAAILQAVKANYQPDYMLVNPSTLANMKLTKDSTGNYIIAPFVSENGLLLSSVRVIANNRIADDAFLVGDFKRAKLLMRRALTLKMFDQNENDPLTDMRTITGSLRAVFRVKTPDLKGFVKGTFTTARTAITAP